MEMVISEVAPTVAKLSLRGRLDTPGVDRIETRFTAAVTPTGKHALIDLSGVSALTSMGIRMLISTARAMQARKTKMVIFGAQDGVMESLEHVSLDQIIPIVATEDQALAALEV